MRTLVFRIGALLAIGAALTACGEDESASSGDASGSQDQTTLTIYSGREEEIVEPLFEMFEQQTGIKVEVRYGDSAELAATIAEEGGNSPADVFFSQDAGALGAVAQQGALTELPAEILDRVPSLYRDPAGLWTGTSGRVRVVAYNTDALSEGDVPDTIWSYTEPEWKGKIGLPPTNASFQAFVTALRLTEGDERARQWLDGIRANDVKFYEKNGPVLEALAAGEIEVGFVNHYYLALLKEEQPDAPVANRFMAAGDPGALVNVAGVGVLATTDDAGEAERFVEFLLSDEGQRFYPDEAEESEYPLVAGIDAKEGLPPLGSLQGPDVPLGDLGPELEATLVMLSEAGYTY